MICSHPHSLFNLIPVSQCLVPFSGLPPVPGMRVAACSAAQPGFPVLRDLPDCAVRQCSRANLQHLSVQLCPSQGKCYEGRTYVFYVFLITILLRLMLF